jgi:hypothetical protein
MMMPDEQASAPTAAAALTTPTATGAAANPVDGQLHPQALDEVAGGAGDPETGSYDLLITMPHGAPNSP